jgi:hypothetical protein
LNQARGALQVTWWTFPGVVSCHWRVVDVGFLTWQLMLGPCQV